MKVMFIAQICSLSKTFLDGLVGKAMKQIQVGICIINQHLMNVQNLCPGKLTLYLLNSKLIMSPTIYAIIIMYVSEFIYP